MKLEAKQRIQASHWQEELAKSPKLLKGVTALSRLVSVHDISTDGYDNADDDGVYDGCEVYFSGKDHIPGSYETGLSLHSMQAVCRALSSEQIDAVICGGDNGSRLTIVLVA